MSAIPTNLTDQLIRDENMKLFPYTDTVGKLTIGVGRNLTDVGISRDEAVTLLQNDIAHVTSQLAQTFPWTQSIDGVRRDAMLNMCFNLGLRGLTGFRKFLSAMQVGDWATAVAEMMDSAWAGQVGDRAKRLARQIETGEYQ